MNTLSENFSATLQSPKPSASQAQSITRETAITLEKLRDDDYFLLFWKEILTESKQLDIDEPVLGRKRKASRRIEGCYSSSLIGFFHEKFEVLPHKFTLMYWIYLLMQSNKLMQ